jgi:hypothetical protein
VERALTLVATGTLTIARARGKTIILPRTFNLSTGRKKSTRETAFSESAWGKASRSYARCARDLPKAAFDAMVEDARMYVKPTCAHNGSTEIVDVDEDEHACLADNSESDEERR